MSEQLSAEQLDHLEAKAGWASLWGVELKALIAQARECLRLQKQLAELPSLIDENERLADMRVKLEAEVARLKAENLRLAGIIENTVTLIRRLCRRAALGDPVSASALDYLERAGFTPNILREQAIDAARERGE